MGEDALGARALGQPALDERASDEHARDARAVVAAQLPEAAWSVIDRSALAGRTLFLTGATGFVGGWVLAAIARFNETSGAPLTVRALTRIPQKHSAPWLTWVQGDVREFTDAAKADFVLHAALPSTATPTGADALLLDTARRGAEEVMKHAARAGAKRTVVLSSGAVYGSVNGPVREDATLGPLAPDDSYALAKREVETIAKAAAPDDHEVCIARLFTCIGEGYRNHQHLAHVALMDDARAGRPLVLRSDGTALRSYLAGEDLAVWLLALLSQSGSDTVNVGSDTSLSVRTFAEMVARLAGRADDAVQVGSAPAGPRAYFVPDITRARIRYGFMAWTPVEQVIARLLRAPTAA